MKRFIDDFPVLLFDMGRTFMFGGDRFGAGEDFHCTYRSIGGKRLSSRQVDRFIRDCFDGIMRDYNDPACYENFPTLAEAFKGYTEAPSEELTLLENVFALHEFGTVSKSHVALLRCLARTRRLGLVSNIWSPKQHCLAEFIRAGIDAVFRSAIFSSDFRSIKPSPFLFEEALRGIGARPHETVFIGDDLQRDIMAAKKIGMATVWITSQSEPHPSADFVLSDVEELDTRSVDLIA